jgi:hypothetical protein
MINLGFKGYFFERKCGRGSPYIDFGLRGIWWMMMIDKYVV